MDATRKTPAWMPGLNSAVWTDTQTRPFPTAIACGLPPTLIVCTTLLRSGSIRDTVPSRLFATQTLPSPTAMPVGPRPTGIVVVTELVAGSIRTTAPSRRSATQTAPSPTAIASGPFPTGVVAVTRFRAGSMRATLLPCESLAHTAPAPIATLARLFPVSIRAVTAFPAGSRRSSNPPLGRRPNAVRAGGDACPGVGLGVAARQQPPTRRHDVEARVDPDQLGIAVGSPADDPDRVPPHGKTLRNSPDRDDTSDLSACEVDARDVLIEGVGDPQAPVAKSERARAGADCDLARHPIRARVDDRDRVPRDGRRRHGVIAPNEDCSGSHRDSGSRSEDGNEQTLVADQPSPTTRARPSPRYCRP